MPMLISPSRLLGIAGAVAITLILQAYAFSWYVWIPAAVIAYAIGPIFLGLPFRLRAARRARSQQPSNPPLTGEQVTENLRSILGDRE